jgi:hypothetical protein
LTYVTDFGKADKQKLRLQALRNSKAILAQISWKMIIPYNVLKLILQTSLYQFHSIAKRKEEVINCISVKHVQGFTYIFVKTEIILKIF